MDVVICITPFVKHPELWQLQRLHNPVQAGIALSFSFSNCDNLSANNIFIG